MFFMLTRSVLIFLLLSASANALVIGGTNFTGSPIIPQYPDFDETVPYPPFNNDKYSLSVYRSEVHEFTQKVKEYVENSDNDIKRIQEAQAEAIEKANQVVEEYNSFIDELKRKKY